MSRVQEWNNVRGSLPIELYRHNGELLTARDDKVAPEFIQPYAERFTKDDCVELVIEFLSSGYYDPGNTYGPPEKCYPEEGSDERELDVAYLYVNKEKIKLPIEVQEAAFAEYLEEIDETELEERDE